MAHFAKLDDANIVTDVITVNNDQLNSNDEENSGIEFLQSLFGADSSWKQTSYNSSFRFNFAGIGFSYDPIDDAFIAPAPCSHEELILNDKKQWECVNAEHEPIQ